MPQAVIVKVLVFVVKAVAAAAISYGIARLTAKDLPRQDPKGREIMIRGTTEPKKIVFGEALVSGPVAFVNTKDGVVNDSDILTDLWHVVLLAGHEVEDITDIWLDGDRIPEAAINWGSDGKVTSGDYQDGAFFYRAFGTDDQAAMPELLSAWPSDFSGVHRGRGIAYIASLFRASGATTSTWQRGNPNNIRALVKGAKVYDPRKDSTNGGSGSHRLNDRSTWEWSDNPILCTVYYLIDDRLGMGLPDTKIDWPTIITHADRCDELVDIPASGTQKRYTCNGVLYTDAKHGENLRALMDCMAGELFYSAGKYYVRSGGYEAPTLTIDEGDLIAPIEIRTATPKQDRFNTIRGVFVDPTTEFKDNEFPQIQRAAHVTRDNGEVLYKDVNFPLVDSSYQAQRLSYLLVDQADQEIACAVVVNAFGVKVRIGDRVQLNMTHPAWSNKIFKVLHWVYEETPEGLSVRISLREDVSTIYDDPDPSDYVVPQAPGTVNFNPFHAPPVQQFLQSGVTGIPDGIRLSWTNSNNTALWQRVNIYASQTNDYATASKVGEVDGDTFEHTGLGSGATWYYWLTHTDHLGRESVLPTPVDEEDGHEGTSLEPVEEGATNGAKIGTNLVDSGDTSRGDEEVLNTLIDDGSVGGINPNSSMRQQREYSLGGTKAPMGWYRHGAAVNLRYEDDAAHEVLEVQGFSALEVVGSAIPVSSRKEYLIKIKCKLETGTGTLNLRAVEKTTELADGKVAIAPAGASDAESYIDAGGAETPNETHSLTDAYQVFDYIYKPSANAKWMSPEFYVTGDASGRHLQVEHCTISERNVAIGAVSQIGVGTASDVDISGDTSGGGNHFGAQIASVTLTMPDDVSNSFAVVTAAGWIDLYDSITAKTTRLFEDMMFTLRCVDDSSGVTTKRIDPELFMVEDDAGTSGVGYVRQPFSWTVVFDSGDLVAGDSMDFVFAGETGETEGIGDVHAFKEATLTVQVYHQAGD